MNAGSIAPEPAGFIAFAMHYPGECAATADAVLPEHARNEIATINRSVNRLFAYGGDPRAPWKILTVAGEQATCHDYAVTKRHLLASAGIPSGALALAWVHREGDGEGQDHMVLLARCEDAVYVLDNLDDALRTTGFDDNYRWISRQMWGDPMTWIPGGA